MKTIKPISTISYNSVSFLYGVCTRLKKNNVIQFFAFIYHKAESDELKDHIHLWLWPTDRVNTTQLTPMFLEPVKGEDKPVGVCGVWKTSDWYNWYWYVLHDPRYLADKGQSRECRYDDAEIITDDPFTKIELVKTNPLKLSQMSRAFDLLQAGFNKAQVAQAMGIAINQLKFFYDGLDLMLDSLPKRITQTHDQIEAIDNDIDQ